MSTQTTPAGACRDHAIGSDCGVLPFPASRNQAGRLALLYGPDGWAKPPCVFGLRIHGQIDIPLLAQALTVIGRKHSALRMFFPFGAQDRGACLDPGTVSWEIPVADLAAPGVTDRAAAERSAILRLQRCFDPAVPPLFRSVLIKYGPGDWMLGIAVDHLVFDGASIPVFLRDLEAVYGHLSRGGDAMCVPCRASDFTAFCRAERDWLASGAEERARHYWQPIWEGMGPFPQTGLGLLQQGAGQASRGAIWRATLPARCVTVAQRQFRSGHVSLFALAAGAVLTAQAEVTGRWDVALLHPFSRRTSRQTAEMIGYLTNRILLRVEAPRPLDFPDVVRLARSEILNSLEHGMMPFERLMQVFSPAEAGRKPASSYVFLNVHETPQPPRLGDALIELTWPMVGDAFADVPSLQVNLVRSGPEALTLSCGYQENLFPPGLVNTLLGKVVSLLISGHGGAQPAPPACA